MPSANIAPIPPLATLGRRIMVLGLTNSGKSTLALALSAKLGTPAIHLDQLRHLPNTNWQERTDAEFAALHDEAILAKDWIVDGSYSKVMTQRLARATGIIVLTDSLLTRYWRYFTRTLFQEQRAGGLEGGADHVNRKMVHWLWHTRHSIGKYHAVARSSGLPHVFVNNEQELKRLYSAWDLKLPCTSPART